MPRYPITPQAQRDLLDIRRFTVQQWDKAQSPRYLEMLRDVLQHLADMPEIGVMRAPELGAGIRSFPYASHMIYYRDNATDISVLAILHQSRVPSQHLTHRL